MAFLFHRRPGVGHRKNAHRNALIIGEIEVLASVGFRPTRNEISAATNACDVVVEALKQSERLLRYSAVASIWNNRNKWPMFGSLLTDLVDAMSRRDP